MLDFLSQNSKKKDDNKDDKKTKDEKNKGKEKDKKKILKDKNKAKDKKKTDREKSIDEKREALKKQRDEKKRRRKEKERKKKEKKGEKVRGRDTYLAPIAGYEFLPSYVKAGNRYATFLKIDNRFGMNRNQQFGWFIRIIPEIVVDGVKAYLIETDRPVTSETQQEIMTKNIHKVIRSQSSENDARHENKGDRRLKDMTIDDLEDASVGDSGVDVIIDCQIYIALVSESPDAINEQYRKLNTRYGEKITGVKASSVAGGQEEIFDKILEAPLGGVYDYTWMSSDFSGNDHAVRKGLDDRHGIPIGDITESYSAGTTALMELDNSFKRRILIAAQPEAIITHDYPENTSASSMWGQLVANDAMMNGKRTFHIVLNGFKYYGEPKVEGKDNDYDAEPIVNTQLEYTDMSKGGINPLEMFGDVEDVVNIYNTALTKITHMSNLISDRELEKFDTAPLIDLKKALNQFYISRKLWDENAHVNPEITRVLNIKNHESFPTMGDFISKISTMLSSATHEDDADKRRNARFLYEILDNALTSYRGIFNEPTTLPDPKELTRYQNYYDISDLETNPNIMEAQFLNVFDYVATACNEGDILMIHGIDRLSMETLELIENRLNILSRKNIRLAYIFDTIGGGENKNTNKVKRANIFNTEGILYQNFDMQFDYTILGSMSKQDLTRYEDKVKQKLTQNLKESLTSSDNPRQYQIRRKSDLTTVMVLSDFLI